MYSVVGSSIIVEESPEVHWILEFLPPIHPRLLENG